MTSFLHALFWIYRVVGRHLIRHLHAVTLLALSMLPNRLGMVIIVHPDHRAWASTSFRIHRRRAKSSNVSLPVELDTWRVWSAHKAKLRSSIQRPLVLYLGHLCGGRVWIFKNPSKIVFHCCKKQKKTKRLLYLKGKYTQSHTSFPNFSFAVIIHCCEFALANVWFIWNRISAKWVSLSDLQISRGFHLVCNVCYLQLVQCAS